MKEVLPYFFKAFPDFPVTIEQIISEGDNVVLQATATGTQMSDFANYSVSNPNNKFNISEVWFFKSKRQENCGR